MSAPLQLDLQFEVQPAEPIDSTRLGKVLGYVRTGQLGELGAEYEHCPVWIDGHGNWCFRNVFASETAVALKSGRIVLGKRSCRAQLGMTAVRVRLYEEVAAG